MPNAKSSFQLIYYMKIYTKLYRYLQLRCIQTIYKPIKNNSHYSIAGCIKTLKIKHYVFEP